MLEAIRTVDTRSRRMRAGWKKPATASRNIAAPNADAARAQMGDQAFVAAWAAGAGLTLDAAIGYALAT